MAGSIIGHASFYNWRKQLSEDPTAQYPEPDEAAFLDLSSLMGVSGSGWNIALGLGNGVELRLSQHR